MSLAESENLEKGTHLGRNPFRAVAFILEHWYPFIHYAFIEVPGNKRSIRVEVGRVALVTLPASKLSSLGP